MTLERDKFLTEAMGECWHEGENNYGEIVCQRCHRLVMEEDRLDFSTWTGFGKLWEWAQEQDWYVKFVFDQLCSGYHPYPTSKMDIPDKFIHPDHFAGALYKFLKERI